MTASLPHDPRKSESEATARPARPRRRRTRWLRYGGTLAILAVLVAGAGLWYVTRSAFITARVVPELERLLGGEVTIGGASYEGGGRFVFRDTELRVRGMSGEAGRIFEVGLTELVVDMDRLLGGGVALEYVELTDAHVRLSESADHPGRFTFMSLAPDWSSTTPRPVLLPPRIHINGVAVEMGTNAGTEFTSKGTRVLAGQMRPAGVGEEWYDLTLFELGAGGRGDQDLEGIRIDGRWNVRTNAHSCQIRKLALDDRAYDMCPQVARLWWDRLDLSGHVSGVDFEWSFDDGFQARLVVEDVGLTLPIETDELWARYRDGAIEPSRGRPRMNVSSGTLEFSRTHAVLDDLVGELLTADGGDTAASVPYRVTVRINDIPAGNWAEKEQWLDEALSQAAFNMQFRADEFRVRRDVQGQVPAVELPLPVARVLEKFRFSDWVLSTAVEVWRDPPSRDASGAFASSEIQSRGQAYITNGSGTYEKFPYPLSNVEAYLEFDTEKVTVHYVTGEGSDDAKVRITGRIAPPTREAEIALRLSATDVPCDNRLRGALMPSHRKAFDALLSEPSFEALRDAGLLHDEGSLAAIEREIEVLEAIVRDLRRTTPFPDDTSPFGRRIARLTEDIDQRQEIVDAGPFRPGGVVDLDLRIDRPRGPGHRTLTTGTMRFESLGLVYDRFPYPLFSPGGTIHWRSDHIELSGNGPDGGVPVVTAGGGTGSLRGVIAFESTEDGPPRITPDLTLTIDGDSISDVLCASIPLSADERTDAAMRDGWPGASRSRGGQLLQEFNLTGRLDYVAKIGLDNEQRLDFHVDIDLRDGRAVPVAALAHLLGDVGSVDAADWTLEECHGHLHVSRDAITLTDMRGFTRSGGVTVNGRLDLRSKPTELELRATLDDMPLTESLLGVLPADRRARGEALWAEYELHGAFDAEVLYHARGNTTETLALDVRPTSVVARIDGEPVELRRREGSLTVHADRVSFDDLRLDVLRGGADDGTIVLHGALQGLAAAIGAPPSPDAPASDEPRTLTGHWRGARFESPLVIEAIRVSGSESALRRFGQWQPRGRFDAAFEMAGDRTYSVRLAPRDLDFVHEGTTISAEVDPGGAVIVEPGQVRIEDLVCRRDGERLEVSGVVALGDRQDITLDLEFEGRLRDGPFTGLIPANVRRGFAAIELAETQTTALTGGRLRMLQLGGPKERRVEFGGRFLAHDASIKTGVSFSEMHGPIDVHFEVAPDVAPVTRIRAASAQARLFGQALTDVTAMIELDHAARTVAVREFRADGRDGIMTAEVSTGLDPGAPYEVSAQLIGMPVADFRMPVEDEEDPAQPRHAPTGKLYASLDFGGARGDPSSRTGRGVARIMDGQLARVPFVLQMLQVLHLTIPGSEWDYADTDFFIVGDRLVFEKLLFESTIFKNSGRGYISQELSGHGELNVKTWAIDARLRSRGGLLIVRDVVGEIGDQLAAIKVTGTLWKPEPSLVPLPGLLAPTNATASGAPPLVRRREEATP